MAPVASVVHSVFYLRRYGLLIIDRFVLPLAIGHVSFSICDPPDGGVCRDLSLSVWHSLGRACVVLFPSIPVALIFPFP